MHTKQIGRNIYLIDLETGGYKNFIGSYVIKTPKTTVLVESGPTNSVPNLLCGLAELKVNPENVDAVAVTHIHLDHGGGAGTLLKHLPNAKVNKFTHAAPHTLLTPKSFGHPHNPSLALLAKFSANPNLFPKTA